MKQDKLAPIFQARWTSVKSQLPENVALKDDTRTLNKGDVFIWDSRIKPDKSDAIIAEAKTKGATVITNVKTEGTLYAESPGQALALYASHINPKQPEVMMGVTGTSGKTSTAWFGQQLARGAGFKSASVGTLGTVQDDKVTDYSGYTSPSALHLHPILEGLANQGVTHTVMEVSSHALALNRADAVHFKSAGITNITQDHFDFHGNYASYFEAKSRLFSEVLNPTATAVIPIQRPELWPLAALCKARNLATLTVGTGQAELVVEVVETTPQGLHVKLKHSATPTDALLPLVGSFQAENVALSLGLLVGAGVLWSKLTQAITHISSVPGRMEIIPTTNSNQPTVVVDYAHKPDALKRALEALRPLTTKTGGKLIVVFGCGGNRDTTKRPLMGQIAAELADVVVITDDNPRHENPTLVREAIETAAKPKAKQLLNIGDRKQAIQEALNLAKPNDVILVAGKGHEDGQIIGSETIPFDDRLVVKELLT